MEEDTGAATGTRERRPQACRIRPTTLRAVQRHQPRHRPCASDDSSDCQLAFGEATAHRDDGLHEINVTPGQRNELSLTHPGCSRRGYPPRGTGLRAHSPSDAVVEAMPL